MYNLEIDLPISFSDISINLEKISVCNFLVHEKCLKTICNPCVGVAATLVQHPVIIIILIIIMIIILVLSLLLLKSLSLSLSSHHSTAPGDYHDVIDDIDNMTQGGPLLLDRGDIIIIHDDIIIIYMISSSYMMI